MKIALMGSRGVPASYSGFETFYEELGSRLAARGHDVIVYNRSNHVVYKEPTYRGMRLVPIRTIPSKHLDTIVHTSLSVAHSMFSGYDVVYFCGVGNAPLTGIPRLVGARTFLNVDGADWERAKWSPIARAYLKSCVQLARAFAGTIITDSRVMQERYRRAMNCETVFVPYGANPGRKNCPELVQQFGLEPGKYILFVSRLVPENGAHLLIEAFRQLQSSLKLVIVGDAPYSDRYKKNLHKLANDRVIFTGYVFGEKYQALSSHCILFVLPSCIDGTRPVLLDQMAFGNCVLVANSPGNQEVIGEAGDQFDAAEGTTALQDKLNELISNPRLIQEFGDKALARVKQEYDWDKITDRYEEIFCAKKG